MTAKPPPIPTPQLSKMRFTVERPDGTTFEVRTQNADLIQYDITAYQRKWPPITEGGAIIWGSFLAWHAARRTGAVPTEVTWEVFRDTFPDVTLIPPAGADLVDPTELVADTGL